MVIDVACWYEAADLEWPQFGRYPGYPRDFGLNFKLLGLW